MMRRPVGIASALFRSALLLWSFGCARDSPPRGESAAPAATPGSQRAAPLSREPVPVPTADASIKSAWEGLRYESPSAPPPAELAPSPELSASSLAPPVTTLSSMDAVMERARALEPRVRAIAQQADVLDRNFRWYIDACYQKYTSRTWTGTGSGTAHVGQYGADVGRDWFVVWTSASSIAWQDSWAGESVTSNETTVECRKTWSDIEHGSSTVAGALDAIETQARTGGVLPGHLRDLLAAYHLVR